MPSLAGSWTASIFVILAPETVTFSWMGPYCVSMAAPVSPAAPVSMPSVVTDPLAMSDAGYVYNRVRFAQNRGGSYYAAQLLANRPRAETHGPDFDRIASLGK